MSEERAILEQAIRVLKDNTLWSNDFERELVIEQAEKLFNMPSNKEPKVLNGVEIGSAWWYYNNNCKTRCVVTHFIDGIIFATRYMADTTSHISCNSKRWFEYFEPIKGYNF